MGCSLNCGALFSGDDRKLTAPVSSTGVADGVTMASCCSDGLYRGHHLLMSKYSASRSGLFRAREVLPTTTTHSDLQAQATRERANLRSASGDEFRLKLPPTAQRLLVARCQTGCGREAQTARAKGT